MIIKPILDKLPDTIEEFDQFLKEGTMQIYKTTAFVLIGDDKIDFSDVKKQIELIKGWFAATEGAVVPSEQNPEVPFESTDRFAGFTRFAVQNLSSAQDIFEDYLLFFQEKDKQEIVEGEHPQVTVYDFTMRAIFTHLAISVNQAIQAAKIPEIKRSPIST